MLLALTTSQICVWCLITQWEVVAIWSPSESVNAVYMPMGAIGWPYLNELGLECLNTQTVGGRRRTVLAVLGDPSYILKVLSQITLARKSNLHSTLYSLHDTAR